MAIDGELNDPAGVWDDVQGEKRELLKKNMHAPILEAQTEWIEEGVRWVCPECDSPTVDSRFYGTTRCDSCMKIMQSKNWEVGEVPPNPYAEEEETQGVEEEEPTQQSALSW